MSEVQLLFAVLAGLYLWECACWLRRGAVGFGTWWGRAWKMWHPAGLIANSSGGFALGAPLPPLGSFLVTHQLPFTLTPEGVLFFVSTNVNPGWRGTHSGRWVGFGELHELKSVHRSLRLQRTVLLKTHSPGRARELVALLGRLAKLPLERRAAAIQTLLDESLDRKAFEERLREAQGCAAPSRHFANALFCFLFILAPVTIWRFGLGWCWPGLLIGLLALTIGNAVYFRRGYLKLFPNREEERFSFTLMVALAPACAARAHDVLLRDALERFHPLPAALTTLPRAAFEAYARRLWRDLRNPALPRHPAGEGLERIEAAGRESLRNAVAQFLKRAELDPKTLETEPERSDPACQAYCPRCEAQFTTPEGRCADCGGLALVEFSKPV